MTSPPVVLVPGMLCDAGLWSGVDVPGPVVHAEITAPSIGGMAEQILSAVDGPFVLVGVSLGAIAGFEVARRTPERLAGFCAVSTNAGAPSSEQLAGWAELDRLTAEGGFEEAAGRILPTMFADPDPALYQRFLVMARRIGPDTFRAQLAAQATRRDFHPAIAGLSCPVLVLCGARDVLCPPSFHHAIAAQAANPTLRVLPKSGHLLTLEEPAAAAEVLRDWLRFIR
ncbi:pimeloyl-ACP methyl ester carboxylesterase [Amycolatopsis bartoniae]|uniref:alpha/beta fold hydrolase n=1 Tax=Amycolatopsis bartoniae TaxID=941986 RepID=UPI001195ADD8|nr:alpha/beta hydrolase [Amycolatopsis bartoniae]MBB2939384.1 pimeloyl-ACP methyl ester carboxylesterase [Amycolatopsis bartoniae]TVT06695.1 alpha/beta hydrolase [Amycolatopsis bartoniae]